MSKIRVGLVAQVLVPGDKNRNLQVMRHELDRYKDSNVDLFVFPESNISGGFWSGGDSDFIQLAESVPGGESCHVVETMAREFNTTICAGIVEGDDGEYFITHFVYGPEGYAGKQRKLFPGDPTRQKVFTSGKIVNILSVLGFRCAILACADFLLPEPAILAGLQECSLLLAPTDCFTINHQELVTTLLRARAIDTASSTVAVFGNGETFGGEVMAVAASDWKGQLLVLETTSSGQQTKTLVLELPIKEPGLQWGGTRLRADLVLKPALAKE